MCMIFKDEKITYKSLMENINARALYLSILYKKGEIVLIKSENPINLIINFLACSLAGLISVPIDNKILDTTLNKIIERIRPCCIIDDKLDFENHEEEKLKKYLPLLFEEDIFMAALSSGTTGHNKIIMRDHKSWTSAFKYQSEVFHINKEDVLFLVGSLSYTGNLNSAMHILNEGGCIVFASNKYPKTWINEIKKYKVSSIFMVPAHYRMLLKVLKDIMPKIKSILSAGEKLDLETINLLREKFSNAYLHEYYGASELGHVTYVNLRDNFKIGSVGKAFPEVEFWLENNLIWVKSPYIAPQFRPKATVLDIGNIDEEGNLFILGRENNTINKGGIKILPSTIEESLNRHPQIIKSLVFGIKHPVKGEEIAAVIMPSCNKLTLKEVMEYCNKNLEIHQRPQRIKIVNDLKLNSSGKIAKNEWYKFFEVE